MMLYIYRFTKFQLSGMRKVILGVAISLDGYIEGPNGEFDWCMTDQDYGMSAFFDRIDSMFIGRKSYEVMTSMGDDAMPGFPPLTQYIFSRTLHNAPPGASLIKENIEEEVKRIKNENGKDIWLFGGADLFNYLFNLSLVDEVWLSVHPIVLGGGRLHFSSIQQKTLLTLIDSKTYSTGLVSMTYRCN
jgi:dihydrofolate reductase